MISVDNNFLGQVPTSLGNLVNLRLLVLGGNRLGDFSTGSLEFITSLTDCSQMEILALSFNNFGGVLPHSIAYLSTKLNRIYLGFNPISGTLPPNIRNLVNLNVFNILDHLFVGVIPTSLGKLTKLQALDLGYNRFSGDIPSSLTNLTQLS